MIIFNELEYAKRLLEEGYIRKSKIKKDLFILCKYYKYMGLSKLQTAKDVFRFINTHNIYVYDELTDKLKKSTLKLISDVYKINYTFRIGINVEFSKSELVEISKLHTNGERQVLFMMLMLIKFYNNKTGAFRSSTKDIVWMTRLFYNKEHINVIVEKLIEGKYIECIYVHKSKPWHTYSEKTKNSSKYYKINLSKCENIIYTVSDSNEYNFIEHYAKCMNLVDEEFKYCTVCGEQFSSKSNNYKYCKECAKQIQLKHQRNSMRKLRSVK